MSKEYEDLLACRLSGQIPEAAWQEHLEDEDFFAWLYPKAPKGLKCDACGQPAIGVASSCIPISFAYCERCIANGVEPEFIFAYHYDEVSHDGEGLADWFTQSVKMFKDGEIWDWDRYVKWRHETGRGKSEPVEIPPPPPCDTCGKYENELCSDGYHAIDDVIWPGENGG